MQQDHAETEAPDTLKVAVATPPRLTEATTILRIAAPLAAAYLADFAMSLTTKAIVGRLGALELASIGFANDKAWEVIIVLIGVLSVVGVLVAQADGAGRNTDAGVAVRQGFFIATVFGALASILVWNLDRVLALTGQDPEVIALMGPYLRPLSGAILPLLWFFLLRTFVAALARPAAVMVITICGVGLNYVLCLGLIEGAFGLPALGVAGAGWAKTITSIAMLLALLAFTYWTPSLRGYGVFRGRLRFDWVVQKEILRLGLPVACIVIMETGLFAAVAIFAGQIGRVELATYQIMFAWIGIAFMQARGLAEAGMVRVSHGVGRGDAVGARRSGLLAMSMGVALLIVLAIVPLTAPEMLVSFFLRSDDPDYPAVLEMASRLLLLAAFFQIFDGLQVMATLALRGLKDTIVPLWLAGFGYWVCGIAGGWLLAFEFELGLDGLWWGMAVGLTVTGSLLATRFWLLTRPGGRFDPAPV